MNNKIKSTSIYRYNYPVNKQKNDDSEKGTKYSSTFFDKSGNILEELKFNEDGEVDDKIIYTYDESGKLIEMKNFYADDELAEHNTYERDAKGNIVVSYKHYQDGEKDTIKYFRDADDNLTEKITIDSFGEEESKETITYTNGKIIQRKVEEYDELTLEEKYSYFDTMILQEYTKWSVEEENARFVNRFDENGRIIKILKYNTKGELLAKTEYFYNTKDNLEKMVEEFPGGKNTSHMFYDDNNNLIRQTETNQKGGVINEVNRKYNTDNDIVESFVEINQGNSGITTRYLLSYEYTYFD